MCAIERSRAVAGRFTPRASATSRPCAQVSISRAVAIDAALIGGPNHGSLRPSATASSSSCSRARVRRQSASSWSGGTAATSSAPSSTNPVGLAAATSSKAAKPASSVTADQRDTVGPQQVRDLVGDGPAGCRRGRGPPLGRQVGDQAVEFVAFGTQIRHDRARSGHAGHLSRVAGAVGRRWRARPARSGRPPSRRRPAPAHARRRG